jgi:methyl-accepting chemotaxis protein
MSLQNLTVRARLIAGFSTILFFLLLVVGYSLKSASNVNDLVEKLSDQKVPNLVASGAWQVSVLQSARHMRNMLILDDPAKIAKEVESLMNQKALRKKFLEDLQKNTVLESEINALKAVIDIRAQYVGPEDEFIDLIKKSDFANAKISLLEKSRPLQLQYIDKLDALIKTQTKEIEHQKDSISDNYSSGRTILMSISVFALLLGSGITFWITRQLKSELGGEPKYASEVCNQIAAGDLRNTVHIEANDRNSLLFAMEGMRTNLSSIVNEIRVSTSMIASGSSQIASGNMDLSSRTEHQAGTLEETASSMEELTSTVKQNADNARHASKLANSASEIAEQGGNVVSQVIDTMSSINESAKKISDIIGVIDGIAFQTNILALNAAVEAARAGEQGRGFAVVASEVRNLAQRSAAAAKEIKSLIVDSVDKVDAGGRLVNQAGVTMSEVVTSIRKVNDVVSEISEASGEQSRGIDQINQAIINMDEVTQQNAALVEEIAAAAKSMQDQALKLEESVSVFKLVMRNDFVSKPSVGAQTTALLR